jgi:hypothetical protein
MSFINNLIRQSKAAPRPSELIVPVTKADAVVEHIIATGWDYERAVVRRWLLTGQMRMHGVPLRVVGMQ